MFTSFAELIYWLQELLIFVMFYKNMCTGNLSYTSDTSFKIDTDDIEDIYCKLTIMAPDKKGWCKKVFLFLRENILCCGMH